MYRALVLSGVALTFLVIVAGAYVRLEDAGLGCPDWPGCYGQMLGVPDDPHEVAKAEQAFPGKTVDRGRAWKEMFHRYLAGTLGLQIGRASCRERAVVEVVVAPVEASHDQAH